MSLTPKQAKFVAEYLVDLNATQAAIRAGYSAKTAKDIGCQNLAKLDIIKAIEEGRAKLMQRVELTQEQVLRDLEAVKADAMQAIFDKDGNRIMADRSAALKALELQGRHLAMFTDKQKVDANHNITWPLPKHPLE